ncbi:hypothetical protein [Agromyces aureus]|uniref:Uncharacterized protein n=1 Tax=Agromyces aureus TaxID=453304 RepID=A0A191WJH6_9MICO|nr:hypothetical protein [Agromyces aureus]ANJ28480.1 hypothetical protein ATC03_19060 [Agromyces aureus]
MTCTVATTEPMPAARACGIRSLARVRLALIERVRELRMSRAGVTGTSAVGAGPRPDPTEAREAVAHYLSMHWVNR